MSKKRIQFDADKAQQEQLARLVAAFGAATQVEAMRRAFTLAERVMSAESVHVKRNGVLVQIEVM